MTYSLKKVGHAFRAPRADLNVELAHIDWSNKKFKTILEEEFLKSKKHFDELHYDRHQFKISYSMLIDDKRIEIASRQKWISDISKDLPFVFDHIDYVTFESDLISLLRIFYSKLSPGSARIMERIERYIKSKKKTACSHDIALWHAMRLGVLGVKNLPIYRVEKADNHLNPSPYSFCSKRVLSVLNAKDREHEEDADTDILCHFDQSELDWRLIQRIFYY